LKLIQKDIIPNITSAIS